MEQTSSYDAAWKFILKKLGVIQFVVIIYYYAVYCELLDLSIKT